MRYNFDEIVPRRNSNSYKWDSSDNNEKIIPMWVADMDFRHSKTYNRCTGSKVFSMEFLVIQKCRRHISMQLFPGFHGRHNFKFKKEELLFTTGVVPALVS